LRVNKPHRFGAKVLAEYDTHERGPGASDNNEMTRTDDTSQRRDTNNAQSAVTWMLLNNLNRVSETVKKVSLNRTSLDSH